MLTTPTSLSNAQNEWESIRQRFQNEDETLTEKVYHRSIYLISAIYKTKANQDLASARKEALNLFYSYSAPKNMSEIWKIWKSAALLQILLKEASSDLVQAKKTLVVIDDCNVEYCFKTEAILEIYERECKVNSAAAKLFLNKNNHFCDERGTYFLEIPILES